MKSVNLSLLYRPITSTPFLRSSDYCEIPPCDVLKPYICCFWGNERPQIPNEKAGRLVIPDTCMDIIIKVNHSDLMVTSSFCTMDEHTYQSHAHATESGAVLSTFGSAFSAVARCCLARKAFVILKTTLISPMNFFVVLPTSLPRSSTAFIHSLKEHGRRKQFSYGD